MNDKTEATRSAPHLAGSPRRVLLGAFAALTAVGAFITTAALVARSNAPSTPPRAELGLVVRTAQHLRRAGDVTPVVERLAIRGVKRAWVQVKQDETDEVPSGTMYAPSRLAPVAPGFADDRLGTFVNELSARGIAPMAWMPVLQDSRAAAAHPEWASRRIEADGTLSVEEGWLCPFNPGVARYEAQVAREIVARYPKLQGLYLDFIRYDDDYSCAGPEALRLLDARTKWSARNGRPLTLMDIRRAGESQGPLWQAWTGLRAEKLVQTVNTIRDAVEEVRPDFRIGAFVLPFSAEDYDDNTQSGQDLERLARAGLDEIVLMGYWDDWDRDPAWVRRGLDSAATLVEDEAALSVVLDGDMGVRRTRLTLDALGPWSARASWFNFDEWTPSELSRLTRAIDGHAEGPVARPDRVSVVVRIDTEPDSNGRYETVAPRMIDTVVSALDDEGVPATFVTVGKLAQQQPDALRRAAAAGHEIASHSGDHEQIDSLPLAGQLASVDRGLSRPQGPRLRRPRLRGTAQQHHRGVPGPAHGLGPRVRRLGQLRPQHHPPRRALRPTLRRWGQSHRRRALHPAQRLGRPLHR